MALGSIGNNKPIEEIKLKTNSNFVGASILSKLGVPIEAPSRPRSLSSNESTQQEKVYSVL